MNHYRTQSEDTDLWAEKIQVEVWRSMTPWQKARQVSELTAATRCLALRGIEESYSGASEEEKRFHLLSRCYGEALARQVFPHFSAS